MSAFTEILNKQGRKCYYCEIPLTRKTATEDHLVPRSQGGGGYDKGNIVLACAKCNSKKGSKSEKKFRELLAIKDFIIW